MQPWAPWPELEAAIAHTGTLINADSHVKGGDPRCQESCESCHLKALAGDEGGSYNTPCGGSRDPDQHVAKEAKGNKRILELGSLSRQKVWGRGSGDGSVTYPSPQ